MSEVKYTGHGAKTGGLQAHSIGDEFPYMVQGRGEPMKWVAVNLNTGEASPPRETYADALSDIALMRLSNEIEQEVRQECSDGATLAFVLGFNAYNRSRQGNPFAVGTPEYGRFGNGWHRAVALYSLSESAAANYANYR